MKNLKTVILCLACFFLFFSCANDFGEGSASVRIDPSIFSRDADGGEFSYVVAIMGETMEPVWKSGSSSSSFTIEFSDLPVGEKAFVYARLESDNFYGQNWYSGCSDNFFINRGIQPVKLKLNNYSMNGPSAESFYIDGESGNSRMRSIEIHWDLPEATMLAKRVSFTVSNGVKSYDIVAFLDSEDYVTLFFNLDYPKYSVSNLKVECFGYFSNQAAPAVDEVHWGYKVYKSPDTIVYHRTTNTFDVEVFEPINSFSF